MPSIQDNIDFVNQNKFWKNSNLTNMLINNMFNIYFNFDSDGVVNNDILKQVLNNVFPIDKLKEQVISFRFPAINTDYMTIFQGNERLYVNHRDDSDIINLSFLEDSNLSVRNFFRTWIKLTQVNQETIVDENEIPYILYPNQYDCKELNLYPISPKFESLSYERYYRVHPVQLEDLTLSLTDDCTLPVVSVSFVYRKYSIVKE